jgi:hypothetical protein
MGEMDCCKAALMRAETLESANARLCCAINCSKEGTSPTNVVRLSPQLQLSLSAFPADAQALLPTLGLASRVDRSHGPPIYSNPAYIRHLSILI